MQRWPDKRAKRRELEQLLRANRPEPRSAFLESLVTRVAPKETPARRRAFPVRLGLAAGFALAFLVAFASLGALGHTSNAASEAVKSTAATAATIVKPDQGKRTASSAPTTQKPEQGKSSARASSQIGSGGSSDSGVTGSGTASSANGQDASVGLEPPVTLRSLAHSLHAGKVQYVRWVVLCVRAKIHGHWSRPFTIAIPDFLLPVQPPLYFVGWGRC